MALRTKIAAGLMSLTLVGAVSAIAAASQAGKPDPSFGGDGLVKTSWAPRYALAEGVAVTRMGQVVVAGRLGQYTQTGIVRYLPGGALDSSFSGDGTLKTGFAGGNLTAGDVLVGRRNRILIGGEARTRGGDRYGIGLARLMPGGDQDASFSRDGLALHFIGSYAQIIEMAFDDAGRIVVAGYGTFGPRKRTSFLVARFRKNGSLDQTFSDDGWRRVSFGSASSFGYSVALDNRGRIVVGGQIGGRGGSDGFGGLARLHPNGALDRSFSGNGKLFVSLYGGGPLRDHAIDSQGRIIAFVFSDGGAVARYLQNGRPDASFSRDGKVMALERWMVPGGVVIDARDRIILAGAWNTDFGSDAIVMRLTRSGRQDERFDGGLAWVRGLQEIFDATLDGKGLVVVTGRAGPRRGDPVFGTARVLTR